MYSLLIVTHRLYKFYRLWMVYDVLLMLFLPDQLQQKEMMNCKCFHDKSGIIWHVHP